MSLNTLYFVRLHVLLDVFFIVEQPATSRMFWQVPWIMLLTSVGAIAVKTYMGSFGCVIPKRTILQTVTRPYALAMLARPKKTNQKANSKYVKVSLKSDTSIAKDRRRGKASSKHWCSWTKHTQDTGVYTEEYGKAVVALASRLANKCKEMESKGGELIKSLPDCAMLLRNMNTNLYNKVPSFDEIKKNIPMEILEFEEFDKDCNCIIHIDPARTQLFQKC